MRVSHETIYRSLFVQARGALRKELAACLRTGRTQRRPGKRNEVGGQLREMVMLSQRPPEAEDRAVAGQWEGSCVKHTTQAACQKSWPPCFWAGGKCYPTYE